MSECIDLLYRVADGRRVEYTPVDATCWHAMHAFMIKVTGNFDAG
jgi:hypothetical protein